MTSRDFCYWLQGFFEVGKPKALNVNQVNQVKAHLALVFKHEIDPSAGGPDVQKILNEIHQAAEKPKPPPRHECPATTVYRC
jgi:hypothetical protein